MGVKCCVFVLFIVGGVGLRIYAVCNSSYRVLEKREENVMLNDLRIFSSYCTAGLLSFGIAGGACADFYSPVSVTMGTNADEHASFPVNNLIDGDVSTNWVTNTSVWQVGSGDFFVEIGEPVLVFDLGTSKTFNRFQLGSYTGGGALNGNSATAFELRASDTLGDFSGSDVSIFSLGNTQDDYGIYQTEVMIGLLSGRYIEMTVTDNDFGGAVGGDRVGFAEFLIDEDLAEVLVLGDGNGDGTVDVIDYQLFVDNYKVGTTLGEGDVNSDGTVDLDDYFVIREEYPKHNGGASLASAIPEPSTLGLLGAGLLALVRRKS